MHSPENWSPRANPPLVEIVETFGGGVLLGDDSLDRAKVGELVFNDSTAREKLEGILHPRIRKVWQAPARGLVGGG